MSDQNVEAMNAALRAMRQASIDGAPAEVVGAWGTVAIAEALPLLLRRLDAIENATDRIPSDL